MGFFYTLLGSLAWLGDRMSRTRYNFVTASAAPLVGLMFIPFSFLLALGTVFVEKEPTPSKVGKIVAAGRVQGPHFVTVKGRLVRLPTTDEAADGQEAEDTTTAPEYVLVDKASKGALLLVGPYAPSKADHAAPITLTGMLRNDTDADEALDYDRSQLDKPWLSQRVLTDLPKSVNGVPLSQKVYLVPNTRPDYVGLDVLWVSLLGVPSLIYLIPFSLSYVIFRRDSRPPPGPQDPPASVHHLAATGRFLLERQRLLLRFLNMSVSAEWLPDGSFGAATYADASIRRSFFFIPYAKEERVGRWTIWIGNGSVQRVERGFHYLGFSCYPAVRVRYRYANTQCVETVVFTLQTEFERDQLARDMQSLQAAGDRPRAA